MSASILILHIIQAVVIKFKLKLMSFELNICLRKEIASSEELIATLVNCSSY